MASTAAVAGWGDLAAERQLQAPLVRWKGAGGSVAAAAPPPLLEALSAWRSYRRAAQWSRLINVSSAGQASLAAVGGAGAWRRAWACRMMAVARLLDVGAATERNVVTSGGMCAC